MFKKALLLAFMIVFVAVGSASWAVPGQISFSGKLTPLPTDPNTSVTFLFYTVSSGGSDVWSWPTTVGNLGLDENGVFSVLLGDPNGPALPPFATDEYYLAVDVGGTELIPRQKIVSVPYAFRAAVADTAAAAGGWTTDGSTKTTTDFKVGIGATDPYIPISGYPAAKLTINTPDTMPESFDFFGGPGIVQTAGRKVLVQHVGFYVEGDPDGSAVYGTFSNHPLYLVTNSQPRVAIRENGNVGIGPLDPGNYKLNVSGDINFTGNLYQNGALFTAAGGLWNGPDINNNIYYDAGSVGIGTTNPGNKLDVRANTNSNVDVVKIQNDSTGSTAGAGLRIETVGNGDAYQTYKTQIATGGFKEWTLGIDTSDDVKFKVAARGELGTGEEWLTIDKFGNVGIRDTSPVYTLDVGGDINFTGSLYQNGAPFAAAGAGDGHSLDAADGDPVDVVYVDNEGNVGIGTVGAPQAKLEIGANHALRTNYIDPGLRTPWDETVRFGIYDNYFGGLGRNIHGGGEIGGDGDDFVMFSAGGRDIVLSPDTGGETHILGDKIGIGKTNPTAKLDVDGNLRVDGGSPTEATISIANPTVAGGLLLELGNGRIKIDPHNLTIKWTSASPPHAIINTYRSIGTIIYPKSGERRTIQIKNNFLTPTSQIFLTNVGDGPAWVSGQAKTYFNVSVYSRYNDGRLNFLIIN